MATLHTSSVTGDAPSISGDSPEALVARLARAGRAAQVQLARLSDAEKAAALLSAADALRDAQADILAANARDLAARPTA